MLKWPDQHLGRLNWELNPLALINRAPFLAKKCLLFPAAGQWLSPAARHPSAALDSVHSAMEHSCSELPSPQDCFFCTNHVCYTKRLLHFLWGYQRIWIFSVLLRGRTVVLSVRLWQGSFADFSRGSTASASTSKSCLVQLNHRFLVLDT